MWKQNVWGKYKNHKRRKGNQGLWGFYTTWEVVKHRLKLVSSELKMHIIDPKEFTKMRKKKLIQKKSEKEKRMAKEDTEQEKTDEIIYLKFAIIIITWCTNDLKNPIKDRGIILNEKTHIRDLLNIKVQIN